MSLKDAIKSLEQDVMSSKKVLEYWGSEKQFERFKDRVDRRICKEHELIESYENRFKDIEKRLPDGWNE